MQDVRNALESYRQRLDFTVNAVRTHIEHFIGSNPLLASTSCTDPVNNLKNPPKQIHVKPPKIVLNLTEGNQQQKQIRSRSPSPFWIKGQTSSYSEVVKSGCVSKNNSRSISPESKQIEGHMSRKSAFGSLQTPLVKVRSKSVKDKWERNQYKKNDTSSTPLNLTEVPQKSSFSFTEKLTDTLNTTKPDSKQTKRRSRSRKNRNSKDNSENEPFNIKVLTQNNSPENIMVDQNTGDNSSIKPEIVVSNVKNQNKSCENSNFQNMQSSIEIVETCTQTDEPMDGSHSIFNPHLLTTDFATPLHTFPSNFSNSRMSLTSVCDSKYSDSCFDLNEQLKGIFGSLNKKHYKNRIFDRPRSKSDTRDLSKLTQIFTSFNSNDKYTCRFERSAESVKNNSNRDSTPTRHSFDNILSSFENTPMELSDGTYNEHHESVRQRVEFLCLEICVFYLSNRVINLLTT